jgi:hypothetical protein
MEVRFQPFYEVVNRKNQKIENEKRHFLVDPDKLSDGSQNGNNQIISINSLFIIRSILLAPFLFLKRPIQ